MVRVPGSKPGRVAGNQQAIVQPRAFVFVESEHRRQMRHHVPKIDDALADIDAGIEEADEIGVADVRLGPGHLSLSRIN